jgi:entry exclusion lipoprotein TrbK
MKKILFGTALAVALLAGCTEEKKPATQTETAAPTAQTQATTTAPAEVKKEETK